MDTTRISIARVLALDVPLTWQDAVAVAQEAAMLSDVNAAMNTKPSLVSAETCFLTRAGDLDLPMTTDVEAPGAVLMLLREMLAGREAPAALESLAYGHAMRDVSGALQQFPIPNRRVEIGKLATRALAARSQSDAAASALASEAAAAPPAAVSPPPAAVSPPPAAVSPPPAAVSSPPARVSPSPVAAPLPVSSASPPPAGPIIVAPPFAPRRVRPPSGPAAIGQPANPESDARVPRTIGAGAPTAAAAAHSVAVPPSVEDDELHRLRVRSVERERAQRRFSKRIALLRARLGRWVTWRPSTPDPRILGGAVVITAAVVSVVWTGRGSPQTRTAPARRPVTGLSRSTAPRVEAPGDARARAPVPGTLGSLQLPTAATGSADGRASLPGSLGALRLPSAGPAGADGLASLSGTLGSLPSPPAGGSSADTLASLAGTLGSLPVPRAPGGDAIAFPSPPPSDGRSQARAPDTATPLSRPRVPAAPRATGVRAGSPPTGPALESSASTAAPAASGETSAAAAPRAVAEETAVETAAVYSSDDADVTPPVMRRQHLPSAFVEPTAEVPKDWPYLELLVDRWGAVEQVRLHARQPAPGQTLYRHRMLLAAAKAWQFEPARKRGAAVRYVIRVPLEP